MPQTPEAPAQESNGVSESMITPHTESTSTSLTQPTSSPNTQEATSANPPTCTNCHKPSTDAKPSKACPKCKSQEVAYCSRECQKVGWKVHKKDCALLAQAYSRNADIKMASRSVPKEGHRGGLQKWQFDT